MRLDVLNDKSCDLNVVFNYLAISDLIKIKFTFRSATINHKQDLLTVSLR